MNKNENLIIDNLKNLYYFKTPYILTILFLIFFIQINFYEDFFVYEEMIKDLLTNIIFTFIGLLGFLLSALTFLLGLVDKDVYTQLNEINRYSEIELIQEEFNLTDAEIKDPLKSLVNDFVFISLIIGLLVLNSAINLILISSNLEIANIIYFYTITSTIIFCCLYIVAYFIKLLSQSYNIFKLFIRLRYLLNLRLPIKQEIKEKIIEFKKVTTTSDEYYLDDEGIMIALLKFISESDIKNKQLYYEETKLIFNVKDAIIIEILDKINGEKVD